MEDEHGGKVRGPLQAPRQVIFDDFWLCRHPMAAQASANSDSTNFFRIGYFSGEKSQEMWEHLHDLLTQNVAGALEVVNVTALICQGNEANLRHVGRVEMPKGIWWNPQVSERICSYNTLPKFTWMLKQSVLSGK